MIEKNLNLQSNPQFHFSKKIISYLDGSLSPEEKSEFEAFVATHPEFQAQIKEKENELSLLKSFIPVATLNRNALESLENEVKLSVMNLLKPDTQSFIDRMKISWEDWINN